MNTPIHILAIETSCDDTAVSVLRNKYVLSNITAQQLDHSKYGGVIPELASRKHQEMLLPTLDTCLSEAKITLADIDAIAYTNGPGLLGALLIGNTTAKSLAIALNKPLISVNHLHAHVFSVFIENNHSLAPSFPFLALIVSGGHTLVIKVKGPFDLDIIGKTRDDAVGEAYDKIARLLGLEYPGGPLIDKLAQLGNPDAFAFPFPKVDGLDFSFSGIKTAIRYFIEKKLKTDPNFINNHIHDICASVQHTLITILMRKLKKAQLETGFKNVVIGGGVAANSYLRSEINAFGLKYGLKTFIPNLEYTTDNAAMIGIMGYYKYLDNQFSNYSEIPFVAD